MNYMQDRDRPLFGISGLSEAFYAMGGKHSYEMPQWLQSIGLQAFEYSYGRGVNIGVDTALKIGEQVKQYSIALSGHAPYFINYGNPNSDMINKSHQYVLDSIIATKNMGGNRVVVHAGVQDKSLTRQESITRVMNNLMQLLQELDKHNLEEYTICLETMGKYSQIGDYQEICELCSLDKRFIPCFDFGHLNCLMQGALKTKDDFLKILDYSINKLGIDKIKNCHVHFSHIQYGKAGELKHIDFDDTVFGPEFLPCAEAIVELKLTPTIICESMTNRSQDALTMQAQYNNLKKDID